MKTTLNINRKATLQRIRSFFNYNYPNYLNLSDLTNYELKSIDYTQPYVTQTRRTDALEKLITQQIEANLIVMSVQQAINKCPDRPHAPYKTILTERYLKFHPAWQVALKIQYSSSNIINYKIVLFYSLPKNSLYSNSSIKLVKIPLSTYIYTKTKIWIIKLIIKTRKPGISDFQYKNDSLSTSIGKF